MKTFSAKTMAVSKIQCSIATLYNIWNDEESQV